MAISDASYRIIKKAIALRLSRGEELSNILESYPKLSEEQKEQLLSEFSE